MNHTHLSPHERYQIELFAQQGLSVAQIAVRLARHRSTIYRECKRCKGRYSSEIAQAKRACSAGVSAANAPRHCAQVWQLVRSGFRQKWSPQQIAGRARLLGKPCASWQAIYGWVRRAWPERAARPLRRAHRVRGAKTWAKGVTGISQRPAEARYRQVLGHWEADTMLGTKSGAMARLLVSVERASRYTRLALLSDAAPQTVVKQLRRSLLANKKPWAVKSLTTDRGGEFAQLPGLLGKRFFVCDPYNPNQRGTNENTIGLIRQYIPKGQPLTLQTPASVRRLERALNSRPRACLGFKTPAEVLLA